MSCINNCRLCNNLVISTAVTFAAGTLTVDLPAGNYQDGNKYCIVIAQTIPVDATISSPVVFTIGGVATPTYPFINEDATPILASQLRTRRLYPTRVNTSVQTGVFRYIGSCLPSTGVEGADSLPIPVTPAAGA
ncbi:MAG: hypothetical protein MJ244_04410 [Clostridia bacterium]|nr:hypothetical protein [Clostridia bacterium]